VKGERFFDVMSRGIFITGTDTGVGKTVVAAGIVRALRRKGVRVGAMKPVETGCSDESGTLIAHDGIFLRDTAGMDDPVELVAPVRFSLPLAPMVASELEGRRITPEAIMRAYNLLADKYEFLVVEGAGGLMVPVTESFFMCDLIREMDIPAVVVARAGLGSLNHTLLTVAHALGEGLRVTGVIINNSTIPGNTIAEQTNPVALRKICPVPVLGIVPHRAALSGMSCDAADAVADALSDDTISLLLS
jgi:dethiobiotin synthetase